MNRIAVLARVLGGLALAAGVMTCTAVGVADNPKGTVPEKTAVVPFKLLKSGHMTVEAKINDKGPFTLIFDTGAPANLLNNKVAREAELLKGKPPVLFAPYGSRGDVKIKKLQVGQGTVENVTAMVMDHPTVEIISKHLGPIEGIVGFPFFARYRMTLDYRDQTLTLEPGTFQPPDVMKEMIKSLLGTEGNGRDGYKMVSPGAMLGIVVGEAGVDGSGVLVSTVREGSPAAAAGLKSGDRLVTLDDRWTDTPSDLLQTSAGLKPGKAVQAEIRRDGTTMKLRVVPVAGF